jgi:signal transduction histidine kinase
VREGSPSSGGTSAGIVGRGLASGPGRLVLGNVVVGVGYWTLAQVGGLAQYTGNIQVAWLPVGFAAAMLYLGDMRWFVGGMVADFCVGSNFTFAVDPTLANIFGTASNTIEFVLAAYLMRRWLGRRNELERPADVGRLFAAIGIGTAFSAVFGTLIAVKWLGTTWSDAPSSVRTWWLGDTSGGLLIAPLLLVWARGLGPLRPSRRQVVEAVVILGSVVGLSVAIFSSHHPLTYLVFPALAVAAVYLGQRGATVALVLAFVVAVLMTAANVGPFVEKSIDDEALSTQLYILVATVTTLTLGATVSARRRAAVELAESRRREAERATEERQRIARDLHDSVSQTLFSLGLHAGIAKHEVARAELRTDSGLPAAIHAVAELAQGALLEMRGSIFDLRGDAVAEQGLVAALGAHAAAVAVRHDVRVTVEGPPQRLPLAPEVEELLFRVGQEAITNAVKHSGSSTVSAEAALEGRQVALVVRDHGIGFDPTRSYGGHLGLELIRSRAADAGGSVTIDSSPGKGTTVRVLVPATATAAAPPAPPVRPVAPPVSVS